LTQGPADEGPEDDLSVDGSVDLFRRVPPVHYRFRDGAFEVKEGAFKNFPHPERKRMSIALGDKLAQDGRAPASILRPGQEAFGVVALRASDVRAEMQRIERTPKDDEPAHGDVYGDKPASRRKRLARMARWVVDPPIP
jgi:hypothetical protein